MTQLRRRPGLLLAVTILVSAGCGQTQPNTDQSSTQCAFPQLDAAHVSFYDQAAQEITMYGPGMWRWDGSCWTRVRSAGDEPGAQAENGLVTYDPDGQRAILFGGTNGEYRHMWAWARGRWSRLADPPAVATTLGGAVGYDAARHQLVVLAMPAAFKIGRDDPRVFSMETWLWDSRSGWRQVHPATQPPAIWSDMVFDSGSRNVLLAVRSSLDPWKVWSWNGSDWHLLPGSIPSNGYTRLVDGGDLGILAVEGGSSLAPPGQKPQVFRLEGGQWTGIGPSTVGPSTVFVPTYDPLRKELVAFGDIYLVNPSGPQVFTQDTWTWTSAAGWSKHAGPQPSIPPAPSFTQSSGPFEPSGSSGPSGPSGYSAPSPSATPCSITQSPPAFAPSPPSDRTLALVTLRGSSDIVVRDVTNIDSPSTVTTPGIQEYLLPRFVNGSELSALSAQGIARMPLVGTPQVQAAYVCLGGVATYGWSQDGRSLTYIEEIPDTTRQGGYRFDWHLVSNGSDRVIGAAQAWCHCDGEGGGDIFDFHVGFSSDGSDVFLMENVASVDLAQIRRVDGTLLTDIKPVSPDSVSMAVWSGGSLYFRDSKGVEVWTDGTVRPFLPGVAWIRPKANPAGGEITYFARGSDGLARVYIVSTATRQVTQLPIAAGRVEPNFLSPRYLWYQGERLCTANDNCFWSKTVLTGVTYIYDRQTGTESISRITAVYDVWPHGS